MRGTLGFSALVIMAASQPVFAKRTVDYSVDDATYTQWAHEQDLAPLKPFPVKSAHHVALDVAAGVDHEVVRGGLACSAWTVDNPISQLITSAMTGWDREGRTAKQGEAFDITVHIDRASTLTRCVGTGELKSICLSRVSINASVTEKNATMRPIHITVERPTKAVGACAGLTRGIALVSREAVIGLLTAIDAPVKQ